jgi:hypothetical protein
VHLVAIVFESEVESVVSSEGEPEFELLVVPVDLSLLRELEGFLEGYG